MTIFFILATIFFIFNSHPLSMCFLLISAILTSSLSTWKMFNTFLPNFLVIMIYVGGMMVLFIYISSMVPNKMSMVNFSKMTIWLLVPLMMCMTPLNYSLPYINLSNIWTINPEIIILLTIFLITVLLLIINITLNPKLPMKSS